MIRSNGLGKKKLEEPPAAHAPRRTNIFLETCAEEREKGLERRKQERTREVKRRGGEEASAFLPSPAPSTPWDAFLRGSGSLFFFFWSPPSFLSPRRISEKSDWGGP